VPQNALSVTVNAQGQVSATVPGQAAPQTLGQLELVRFPNEAGLNALGGNLYQETPSSGSPQSGVPGATGYGTIQQGFLETANVDSVEEITSLITAQRAYEMNSKVITAADDMLDMTAKMAG
jgi:flagellar basal-body rod protein FlgG